MKDVVVNKILCCPKIKKLAKNKTSDEVQKYMTSENIFIVCDDGLGFNVNLKERLNMLQGNKAPRSWDSPEIVFQQLVSSYLGFVEKRNIQTGG